MTWFDAAVGAGGVMILLLSWLVQRRLRRREPEEPLSERWVEGRGRMIVGMEQIADTNWVRVHFRWPCCEGLILTCKVTAGAPRPQIERSLGEALRRHKNYVHGERIGRWRWRREWENILRNNSPQQGAAPGNPQTGSP